MTFVWLASYPKSGNTWLRILLSNYRSDTGEVQGLEADLLGPSTHLSRHMFDETMGLNSSELTASELEPLRRQFHEIFVRKYVGTTFTKTHEAYGARYGTQSIFPAESHCRVIYLVRNPLDVVHSFASHENRPLEFMIAKMASSNAMVGHGDTSFDEYLASWNQHVEGWTNQAVLETLVVRYEDLLSNTLSTMETIISFCGLARNSERLKRAIHASRFENLQMIEQRSAFVERPASSSPFFRSGRCGLWKEQLDKSQIDRIIADHGTAMKSLGYI